MYKFFRTIEKITECIKSIKQLNLNLTEAEIIQLGNNNNNFCLFVIISIL